MLQLRDPYVVARLSNGVLLVAGADQKRTMDLKTMAQIYRDGKYGPARPLQATLKFLYDATWLAEPEPWSQPNA